MGKQTRRAGRSRPATRKPPTDGSPVGSIFGYEIHLYGDDRAGGPGIAARYPVPGGELFTASGEELFKARTDPFTLASIVRAAATITHFQLEHEPAAIETDLARRGWNRFALAPTLVRRLVTDAIAVRQLPDQAERAISLDEFIAATEALMLWGADTDQDFGLENPIDAQLMRLLQYQYHDQLSLGEFTRELWLARETVRHAAVLGLDVESAYEAQLGITFSELAALSFAAFATLSALKNSAHGIDSARWGQGEFALGIPPERVRKFLDVTSATLDQFQENSRHPNVVVPGYEPYALSPLVLWPFLRLEGSVFVAPVLRDVLERATRPMPIEGLAHAFKRHGKRGESQFAAALGAAYERLVGDSLRAVFGSRVYSGPDVFAAGGKQCDFVVDEGSCLTLVEAKSSRFSVRADATKLPEPLKRELGKDGGIADGVEQLYRSAEAIRAGATRFPRDVPLVGLLVARGELVLLNIKYVRGILERLVKQRLGHELPRFRWQIANDAGFDAMVEMAARTKRFGPWLHDKADATGANRQFKAEWDVHTAVSQEFPRRVPHPLLDEWHSSLDDLLRQCGLEVPAGSF